MQKKILIIHVTRIGDTLLTTPAIRAIATAFPEYWIDFFGHPKRAEVIEHLPFIHHVETITKNSAPFRGWFCRRKYEFAFVYGDDHALIAYALRAAEKVVAFRQQNDNLNKRLFFCAEKFPAHKEHAVKRLLRLPQSVQIPPAGMRISYTVTKEEKSAAQHLLTQTVSVNTHPLIGLQVASFPTKAYRDWPVDNFIALCKRIQNQWPQAYFLIFGGSNEASKTASVKSELGNMATLFAGKLSIRQTAALMSCTDLYIGVDTGPTHLMSAFDIPMISLYHSTLASHIYGPLEHPCAYPIDHPNAGPEALEEDSMIKITVDDVWPVVECALSLID